MGTILDSVKAMSEKLGVTEESQTIAEQKLLCQKS